MITPPDSPDLASSSRGHDSSSPEAFLSKGDFLRLPLEEELVKWEEFQGCTIHRRKVPLLEKAFQKFGPFIPQSPIKDFEETFYECIGEILEKLTQKGVKEYSPGEIAKMNSDVEWMSSTFKCDLGWLKSALSHLNAVPAFKQKQIALGQLMRAEERKEKEVSQAMQEEEILRKHEEKLRAALHEAEEATDRANAHSNALAKERDLLADRKAAVHEEMVAAMKHAGSSALEGGPILPHLLDL